MKVVAGLVTLTGFVHHRYERQAAEEAAARVRGVHLVVNDIEVRSPEKRADPEIARDVMDALAQGMPGIGDRLKVTVSEGWVTLGGSLAWEYERRGAQRAVEAIRGVRGVLNTLALTPDMAPHES